MTVLADTTVSKFWVNAVALVAFVSSGIFAVGHILPFTFFHMQHDDGGKLGFLKRLIHYTAESLLVVILTAVIISSFAYTTFIANDPAPWYDDSDFLGFCMFTSVFVYAIGFVRAPVFMGGGGKDAKVSETSVATLGEIWTTFKGVWAGKFDGADSYISACSPRVWLAVACATLFSLVTKSFNHPSWRYALVIVITVLAPLGYLFVYVVITGLAVHVCHRNYATEKKILSKFYIFSAVCMATFGVYVGVCLWSWQHWYDLAGNDGNADSIPGWIAVALVGAYLVFYFGHSIIKFKGPRSAGLQRVSTSDEA